ncbi:MAG: hypothetical protein AVDCRST_MAG12-1269 [uncultured Rubrobacteraceae bacterium]|uniref:Uncharacterized protein n=1 Tax=uncultured Rubrobacteraceae bacterium TaxID=349277 RepID=A0A6J4RU03_9ACTN|nr:MAG: hypothetical protein AVDCRST_MAG12-1269 [uncultured Rubrobacteraceae bacterium]
MLVAGGLGALQSASVLFGVPFAFIMVAMCVAIYMHLRDEAREARQEPGDSSLTIHRRGASPTGGQAFTAEKFPGQGRLSNPGDGRREER